MVLVEKGKAWTGSDAALQLTRYLKPPFSWARILGILPASLHRALYRAVARRRYQWFGSTDRCSLPDPAHSERFLSP
jgi:predicted DCC family thiol-disulfide oxidoreductase YuxK